MSEEAARLAGVLIDRDRCMGSGNCAYWAGEVFDVGEDSVAVVIGDPGAHAPRVRLAAEHCPTHAISVQVDAVQVDDVDPGRANGLH